MIPRTNPDGTVTIRSSPSGPSVTVGGARPIQTAVLEPQPIATGALSALTGSTLVLPVAVGQRLFLSAVLATQWTGANDFTCEVWWDPGTGFEQAWAPGTKTYAVGEGSNDMFPLQGETETATVATDVSVELRALAGAVGMSLNLGHFYVFAF